VQASLSLVEQQHENIGYILANITDPAAVQGGLLCMLLHYFAVVCFVPLCLSRFIFAYSGKHNRPGRRPG
jgi:hypothetical protein